MYVYNVEYIGEHFTMSTSVEIPEADTDAAIQCASDLLQSYYGWDVETVATISMSAEWVGEVS